MAQWVILIFVLTHNPPEASFFDRWLGVSPPKETRLVTGRSESFDTREACEAHVKSSDDVATKILGKPKGIGETVVAVCVQGIVK